MEKFTFTSSDADSYMSAKKHRAIADALRKRLAGRMPRDTVEGAGQVMDALMARSRDKKADAAQQQLIASLGGDHKAVQKLLGIPQYRKGTNNHPGGVALVGEEGAELVDLPKGAKVKPAGETRKALIDALKGQQFPMQQYDPASQERLRNNPGAMQPPTIDTRELLQPQSRFDDAKAYQTADMSGVPPSGVGETNQLHGAARSYQGLMKSLDDYEKLFNEGGSTMWPGPRKDALSIAHRDLQMQMKELYNLGVLNGPDLDLMNQILIDPTSISGNVMDGVGISDMEERIPANIAQVRQLMMNRTTPALQQLGIDPQSLMPKAASAGDMSDEELLKALQGGG